MRSPRDRPLTTALGWRLPALLLDVGPVLFVLLVGLASVGVDRHLNGPSRLLLAASLPVYAVALLYRHRWPLTVLCVTLALAIILGVGPLVTLPVLLAVFTVAEYSDRRRLAAAAIATAAAVLATHWVHVGTPSIPTVASTLIAVGLAIAVGLYLRARADYINGLRDRAERLERERELLAGQAVAEERVRIARELHDVVAHNVSLMVVQSQALAATNGGERQRVALDGIADLGRDALSEMHRMLGVLRLQDGDAPERAPQPGVRDLPTLIARTQTSGLDVSLEVRGEPRVLPAAADLSVYRIVQEALTNVIRHASARHVAVGLAYSPAALEVTVVDDGSGPPPAPVTPDHVNGTSSAGGDLAGGAAPGGHGLVGMRERVALFGGDLEAGGAGDGHGFSVRAVLPVG